MEFAEIAIHSKNVFDRYLKLHNPKISELTFTNLFAWRNSYNFRYTIIAGLLCIISVSRIDEPFALMPVGEVNKENFAEAFSALKDYFKAKGWRFIFKKILKEELNYFRGSVSSEKRIVYDRENSDYLYKTADLINLKGKKFDGKRNHLNKFKKQHSYEYVIMDQTLVGECLKIMEDWCKGRDCSCQYGEYCEKYANTQILSNFNTLGCKGALIKVDGVFEAFTAGEMLNDDTAVIHIEKANGSINGLYPLINQQFAATEWSGTAYINREQDLGIEGMRKAKMSYHPEMLVDKYTVYPDKI